MMQETVRADDRPAPFSPPTLCQAELASGKFFADFPEFRGLVEKYGLGADALRRFGLIHWKSGDFALATEAFGAALAWEPANTWIWEDLGGAYLAADNTKMAFQCVNRSIEIDDGRAQSWLLLATILDRTEDHQGAELAYGRAIVLEETLSGAHFGLGIIHLRNGRLPQALQCLRRAVTYDPLNAFAHVCLGHACYATGDFAGAVQSLDCATTLAPLDAASARIRMKSMTFRDIIEGHLDDALARYSALADDRDQEHGDISQEAFTLLNVYGYREAAHAVGLFRLRRDPDDLVQKYMNSAVAGEQLPAAPSEYIETYFDSLAPGFDRKLVDSLQYRAPAVMAGLVSKHRPSFRRILDLGCGTGLAAEPLSRFGGEVTGIDLSNAMLERARERRFYTELRKVEAIAFLAARPADFDLIFAADVLVYMGDLRALFGQPPTPSWETASWPSASKPRAARILNCCPPGASHIPSPMSNGWHPKTSRSWNH
jgi:predicted TPR repeat methyltransferase